MKRTVVWFSCGAASAVAAKLAVKDYTDVEVVYCDTLAAESSDNPRFMQDVEDWIGQTITIISSEKYASINEVFERERYMSGIKGARCTVEMKKVPRFHFQRPDDIHIFGYTGEEFDRIHRFRQANPEIELDWILARHLKSKADCLKMIADAGIRLPILYSQGFKNNNCIGCVKASSPAYWTKVAQLYPTVFQQRARQSRDIGVRLVRIKGKRLFLDEMPMLPGEITEDLSCGPYCIVLEEFNGA